VGPAPVPYVAPLREGDTVPSFALVDQRGHPTQLIANGARETVVAFFYTRCADAHICLLVAAKFAWMQRHLGGTPIRLVLLTLDPAYDRPPVLARYGAAFNADPRRWTLATGNPRALDELASRLGIDARQAAPNVIIHTEAAIVLDARGRVARIVEGADWLPDDVLADAREVAGAPADPLRSFGAWLRSGASALCGSRGSVLTVGGALAVLLGLLALFGALARRAFATSD
jgi:protein SCO1/2